MTLHLLHLSDLHFEAPPGAKLTPPHALSRATDAIIRDFPKSEFVLVISGDITTRGAATGYLEALRALEELRGRLTITKIVVCPGNHDLAVVAPRDFRDFNQFAFSLTNDTAQFWNETQTVRVIPWNEYRFVLINTSFHGDYRYGSVPLDALREALAGNAGLHLIVVLHHSPISSTYGGGGLSDAYELLKVVSEYGAVAILHGHVHSDQSLTVGRHGTLLFGIGSLGFQPDGNMNNQFAIHDFDGGKIKRSLIYRYYLNTDSFRDSGGK